MSEPPREDDAWHTAFVPYATEIGFLLREWNDLQERLASLFTTLLRIPNGDVARAIWYAAQSDRTQRKMLLGAASAIYNYSHPARKVDAEERKKHLLASAIWEEIEWIIETADNLGGRRDAVAHAPVSLLVGEPHEFIARHFHNNPLAASLRGKKLLDEFQLYRKRFVVVRRHAEAITSYLQAAYLENAQPLPLPKRLPWPNREEPKKDAKSIRKGDAT